MEKLRQEGRMIDFRAKREELRMERWKERARADLQDSLDPRWKTNIMQHQDAKVMVDQAVERLLDERAHSGRFPVEQESNHLRTTLFSKAAESSLHQAAPQPSSSLCEFCMMLLGSCNCHDKRFQNVFPSAMLQDEYAMLNYMQNVKHASLSRTMKDHSIQRAAEYASDLSTQVEQQRRDQKLSEQEEKRYFRVLEEQARKFNEDEERKAALVQRQKQSQLDELDRFCQLQKNEKERRKREQQHIEKQILSNAQREIDEGRQREFEIMKRRKEEAEKSRHILEEQQARKQAALEAERLQDMAYMKMAEEEAERRDKEKEQERLSFLARQERILATVGKKISNVEEERKKALEMACARWEAENKQKEEAKMVADELRRKQNLDEVNRIREWQLYEQEQRRWLAQKETMEHAKLIREQIRKDDIEQEQTRQERARNQVEFRRVLDLQAEEYRATRKQREMIGMNEVERKLNRPLLTELYDFVLCTNGLHHADRCSCGKRSPNI